MVAGIRHDQADRAAARREMPAAYAEFEAIAEKLEHHYRDMQDVEFTIERGKLWMLQTRDAKRTAQAAVRIAVDMVEEGLITREQAVLRVSPDQVDFFLHPQFDDAGQEGDAAGDRLAAGLNVSPGAAVGRDRVRRRHRRALGEGGGAGRSSWCARRPSRTTSTACSRRRGS